MRKAPLWGFAAGLVMPVFGLFIGLQVWPPLADIMLLPVILLSGLLGAPFGYASDFQKILFVLSSGIFWAMVFAAVAWGFRLTNKL